MGPLFLNLIQDEDGNRQVEDQRGKRVNIEPRENNPVAPYDVDDGAHGLCQLERRRALEVSISLRLHQLPSQAHRGPTDLRFSIYFNVKKGSLNTAENLVKNGLMSSQI